jgi:DNA topoisomerase-3
MSKRLVITEKPSVARDIVAALGAFKKEDGYWENDEWVVTHAVGHLFELMEPEDLDPKYKRWTLDTLPIIPDRFELKPKKEHADQIRVIKGLVKRKDITGLVNACDAGREGELIFHEIVDFNDVKLPIQRLWLQSMTQDAIRTGMSSLRPGDQYKGLRDAAYCRTYSDWLIGMNATRALTRRLKTKSENQAWSAGRVQTPTLAMLVDRELEILSHQPQPYWRLTGTFVHASHTYTGTWYDTGVRDVEGEEVRERPDRIFDEARAQALLARVTGRQGEASETRKPSKEAAPPLFDLTSLQREANRRFGWSARRTLNAAQRLYEAHKMLTYPRTDAKALPKDYEKVVVDVVEQLGADARFRAASAYLGRAGLLNKDKIFDDAKVSDHFAIVPTGVLPTAPLDGDDGRLFDLVARRFLAAFHPSATWVKVERTTVVEGEHFRSRARYLQDPGWRAVLGDTSDEAEDAQLPPLVAATAAQGAEPTEAANGVPVAGEAYALEAEETKPASRITEGRLLSLMENAGQQVDDEEAAKAMGDKGIGTPATRADIIENLIAKGYVGRAGKFLKPSVKGIRLIDILHRMRAERLASPQLTGEMEQHLGEVERKKRGERVFMDEIRDYTREIVERTKSFEFEDLYLNADPLGPCPLCQRPVYERSWFYRCEETREVLDARRALREGDEGPAQAAEDCSFRVWKDKSGRYIDRTTVRELLSEKKTRVLEGFTTRQGRTYHGRLVLEDGEVKLESVASADGADAPALGSETPEYEVDEAALGTCPVCKDAEIFETRATFICATARAALKAAQRDEASLYLPKKKELPPNQPTCTFLMPRTVCRREISRADAITYLQTGKTPLIADFISKRGRPFSATLVFNPETGRHSFEFPPRAPREGAEGEGGTARGGRRGFAKRRGRAASEAKGAEAEATEATPKPAAKKKASASKAAENKAPAKAAGASKKAAGASKKVAGAKKAAAKAAPRSEAKSEAKAPPKAKTVIRRQAGK